MRAVMLHSPGDIRLADVSAPVPRPGEVLVRVAAVGVCGSDLPRMLIKGAHRMPLIPGHEFSGHIVEVGRDVKGFETGELVAIPPLIACHVCDQCQRGQFSRCRDYDYFGSRRDGAYAELVAVPAGNLLKTPAGLDPAAVAMVDPASIALHAIWKAGGVVMGRRCGVVGCGPIGLFAIQWMKLSGAGDVVAVDTEERKLALAREAGATHTSLATDPIDKALDCDLVLEVVGHPSSINRAILSAGPGGRVVFIGIPVGGIALDGPAYQHLLRQEVVMCGSWNSFGAPFPGAQWTVTLDKLGSGALRWKFIVSHDLDLAELPRMFQAFKDRSLFYSKVLFRP